MVNFVPAVAYHFCLALHAEFTQPGDHLLSEPCTMPTRTAAVPGMQNMSNISLRAIYHFFAATGLLLSARPALTVWSRVKSSPSELPLTAIGGDGLQCIRRRRRLRNPQVGWGRKTRETNERSNGTHATRNENPPAQSVCRTCLQALWWAPSLGGS